MKKRWPYFLLAFLLIILDQAAKSLVVAHLPLYSSFIVIPGFFNLTHIRNSGAIFGLFSRGESQAVHIILPLLSLAALGFIVYYFFHTHPSDRLSRTGLSIIMAGALGNFIDRIRQGYVVDFLDLHVQGRHWPFFNVADSCITIGVLLLLIALLRRRPSCPPSSSD